ncbi:MAG: nitroreductase family protein [Pleomorphochaeta sp.]
MEAREVLRNRRSVRDFTDDKVDRDILLDILETSTFSPSWSNFQPIRYNIIENEDLKNKIAENCFMGYALNSKILKRAAGVIVLSYVDNLSGTYSLSSNQSKKGDTWAMFDAGIVANQFALASYDKGLSSVILGYFDEDKLSDILKIRDGEIIAAIIAYGYEKKHPNTPKRKSLNEVVRFFD